MKWNNKKGDQLGELLHCPNMSNWSQFAANGVYPHSRLIKKRDLEDDCKTLWTVVAIQLPVFDVFARVIFAELKIGALKEKHTTWCVDERQNKPPSKLKDQH